MKLRQTCNPDPTEEVELIMVERQAVNKMQIDRQGIDSKTGSPHRETRRQIKLRQTGKTPQKW